MAEDKTERKRGTLIIIGGHEDRDPEGDRKVLREVARRIRGGKLVLATVASHQPQGYFDDYDKAFADLDIGELVELYVEDRTEAGDSDKLSAIDDAAGIFFSGGDQLRITSQIGDTGIEAKVRALFDRGGVIAFLNGDVGLGQQGGSAVAGAAFLGELIELGLRFLGLAGLDLIECCGECLGMLAGALLLLVLPVKEAGNSGEQRQHAEHDPAPVAFPGRAQLIAAKLLVDLAVEGFVVRRLDRQN